MSMLVVRSCTPRSRMRFWQLSECLPKPGTGLMQSVSNTMRDRLPSGRCSGQIFPVARTQWLPLRPRPEVRSERSTRIQQAPVEAGCAGHRGPAGFGHPARCSVPSMGSTAGTLRDGARASSQRLYAARTSDCTLWPHVPISQCTGHTISVYRPRASSWSDRSGCVAGRPRGEAQTGRHAAARPGYRRERRPDLHRRARTLDARCHAMVRIQRDDRA